jgi:hypothetical protein
MAIKFPSALEALVANEPTQNKKVANKALVKVANKHGVYSDKEKRREYMRNYMRAKRAKE